MPRRSKSVRLTDADRVRRSRIATSQCRILVHSVGCNTDATRTSLALSQMLNGSSGAPKSCDSRAKTFMCTCVGMSYAVDTTQAVVYGFGKVWALWGFGRLQWSWMHQENFGLQTRGTVSRLPAPGESFVLHGRCSPACVEQRP